MKRRILRGLRRRQARRVALDFETRPAWPAVGRARGSGDPDWIFFDEVSQLPPQGKGVAFSTTPARLRTSQLAAMYDTWARGVYYP